MEKWKAIAGYEGYYEVSNLGNARSTDRVLNDGRTYKGRILAQKTTTNGRKQVHLSKDGKARWISVARLVATSFCPGYFDGAQVNHKDENPLNNSADNLEWCTKSYNCKYGHRNDTMIEQRRREVQSVIGNVIHTYHSIQGASRTTGISAAHICQCCKGERETAGGIRWRYA